MLPSTIGQPSRRVTSQVTNVTRGIIGKMPINIQSGTKADFTTSLFAELEKLYCLISTCFSVMNPALVQSLNTVRPVHGI